MIIADKNHLFIGVSTNFIVENEWELKKVIKILQEDYGYVVSSNMAWVVYMYRQLSNPVVVSLNNTKKIVIENYSKYIISHKAKTLFSCKKPIY